MKSFGSISAVWVLAFILGLTGASCMMQRLPNGVSHTYPVTLSSSKGDQNTATKATIQVAYGQLPLHFEANQGQSDEQVKFLSRGNGYTLFLTSTEAVLALHKPESKAKGKGQKAKSKREEQKKTVGTTKDSLSPVSDSPPSPQSHKSPLAPVSGERVRVRGPDPGPTQEFPRPRFGGEGQGEGAVVHMKLVGANPNPRVVGLDELSGKSHYFIGNDQTKWHTNVSNYARVQYQDIYPGIDLIYYGNQRQLEYDFVVAPGADPNMIRLAFDGLPPHPVPLVAQPSWLRAGWKPAAPLGERGPMPRVFAPSPLAADKGRDHEPKDGNAGFHPLSDSPPSKGERKEVPSPSKGEGEDGGESRLPLRIDDNGDLILHTADGEIHLHKPRIYQEINGVKQPIPGGYVLLSPQSSVLITHHFFWGKSPYRTTQSSALITHHFPSGRL